MNPKLTLVPQDVVNSSVHERRHHSVEQPATFHSKGWALCLCACSIQGAVARPLFNRGATDGYQNQPKGWGVVPGAFVGQRLRVVPACR